MFQWDSLLHKKEVSNHPLYNKIFKRKYIKASGPNFIKLFDYRYDLLKYLIRALMNAK